ncbi:hypothetical protein WS67_13100 [Burkholderia singularis]|uniref:Uncharacterized protein n=1 Tax=Burkholderia singularis TaxID=1503053 RepID=A0A103E1C7_9BURK|nr:hypothetical protein WS67_13100 [Burkholderia singularis]
MRTQMKDEGERRATACDGGKGKRAGIGRRSAFCDFAGFTASQLYGLTVLFAHRQRKDAPLAQPVS